VRADATPVSELLRLIEASTAAFSSTLEAALPLIRPAELHPTGTHLRFD
jgi:hypothetical protein